MSIAPEESEDLVGDVEAHLAAFSGLKSNVLESSQFLLGSRSFRTCQITNVELDDFLAFPLSGVRDQR